MVATAIPAVFGLWVMVVVVLAADRLADHVGRDSGTGSSPSEPARSRGAKLRWAPVAWRSLDELGLRALVWLRRPTLDWALAERPDIHGSRQLQLRAKQLARSGPRRRLGDRLDRLLEASARPAVTTAISPSADALADAHGEILALAAMLRTADQVSPYGVAMVTRLLRDGAGPLYAPDGSADLRLAIESINAELARGSVATLDALWQLES